MKSKLLVLRKLLNYSKSLTTILKCKGHVRPRHLQNQLVYLLLRGKKNTFLGKEIESQHEIQPLYLSEALGTGLISLSATVPWGRPHPGVRLYFPLSPLVLTLLLKVKAPLGQFPPPRHCPGSSGLFSGRRDDQRLPARRG